MPYRNLPPTEHPFDPTRADRILAGFCWLILALLLAYVVLDGTGVL